MKDLAIWLGTAFPEITALYLFGSRRYRTKSPRSDIDMFVELESGAHIRPADLRTFSAASCPALDMFLAEGGEAGISAATFYGWKSRFGGMEVSEAQRLKAMEDENLPNQSR
jgi:hypothetical protein